MELREAEERALESAAVGEWLNFGDGPFELAEMQAWPAERTIRATVLRQLLIGEQWPADPKGVRLRGARIIGQLDFEAAHLRCPLLLDSCYLDAAEPPCFDHAIAGLVWLTSCHMAGISAESLTAAVFSLQDCTLAGVVRLPGAEITGQVVLSGALLTAADKGGNAIFADRIKVGGGLSLDDGFTAAGAVRLPSADITGQLSCRGAQLTGADQDGDALVADGMKVGGDLFLDDQFTAAGAVRLSGAEISGQVVFNGARLTAANRDGNAVEADSIQVGGSVFLQSFTAAGTVRLLGAEITGQVNFGGAQLAAADQGGNAIYADGMKVGGGLLLDDRFKAAGAVRLLRADIAGQLSCRGAQLTGADQDGDALVADGMKVDGGLFLDGQFTAAGTVRLSGAEISHQVVFSGAGLTATNQGGDALVADGIQVDGDVYFDRGFSAGGAIRLQSATVGGSVYLNPVRLGRDKIALNAADMQVADSLVWAPESRVAGQVRLEGASVGQLADDWTGERADAGGYWPVIGLRLDGFTYARIRGQSPATPQQRLAWIRSQHELNGEGRQIAFATQPYEQLASVYRQAGQDREARIIAVHRRADLRRYGDLAWHQKAGNWLLDKTIKYGYQTWRAGAALVAVYLLILAGSVIAQHVGLMIPVGNVTGLHPVPAAARCTATYPCFYPAGYAVDIVIPIINVHQADSWGPSGQVPWGWIWVAVTWAATGLGWALATLLVAGYTGLARRE